MTCHALVTRTAYLDGLPRTRLYMIKENTRKYKETKMITFIWVMFISFVLSSVLRIFAFATGLGLYDELWKDILAIIVSLAFTLWAGSLIL